MRILQGWLAKAEKSSGPAPLPEEPQRPRPEETPVPPSDEGEVYEQPSLRRDRENKDVRLCVEPYVETISCMGL